MAAHHGYSAHDTAWARARLRRGSSGGEIWEISSEYPEARLTLGTDPSCGWPIEAYGVHPVHCELFWDGQSLWVADIRQAGGVFLDGARISDWRQIEGPAELRFGQASLDIETSAPPTQRMASKPQDARPVTVTDMVAPPEDARPSQPVFGGAAGDDSVPDIENQATQIAAPVPELPAERTQLAAPGVAPAAPGVSYALRPRLGGSGGSGPAPGSTGSADATRMVPVPARSPASPGGYPPAARSFSGSPAPVVAPPPAPPPSAAAAAPPPPGFAAPDAAQPPSAPHPAQPAAASGPQPAMGAAPAAAGDPFVGPPEPTEPAEDKPTLFQRILASKDGEAGGGALEHGKQALPLRTWILLGVTLLVTVGWLLWEDEPAPSPPPQGAQPVASAGEQGGSAQPGGGSAEPGPAGAGQPTAEGAAGEPSEPGSGGSSDAQHPPEPSSAAAAGSLQDEAQDEAQDDDERTLQRRGADAYAGGRYEEALRAYRRLSAQNPAEQAYVTMVRVLERRLRERCQDGRGPGGEPCAQP